MTDEGSAADLRDVTPGSASSSVAASDDSAADPSESDMPLKPASLDDPARARKKGAPLTPQTRDRIASQLRTMYDSVASQPIPDRFAELIARLDAADRTT